MRRARLIGASFIASCALIGSAPTHAQAAVTPIVDCLERSGTPGVFYVYFGYVNPGGQTLIDFGDQNQVVPGLGYQGQPTVFNTGSYPRVFKAVFNSNAFMAVAWSLDGTDAVATTATPVCAAGATGPASGVATEAATLHGIVDSQGVQTTYRFEYGETIAYGQTTPERQLTSTAGELVSEPIAGLTPATTYHYRLVADGPQATAGEDRTFTTAAAPSPPPVLDVVDLGLTRSGPRKAKVGKLASVVLTVENRGPAPATGAVITVTAARKLRIASFATPGGACSAGSCALGTIAAGGQAEVTVRMRARRRGAHSYLASVVADQPEARPANNFLAGQLRGR
jgi:hypothetical protein